MALLAIKEAAFQFGPSRLRLASNQVRPTSAGQCSGNVVNSRAYGTVIKSCIPVEPVPNAEADQKIIMKLPQLPHLQVSKFKIFLVVGCFFCSRCTRSKFPFSLQNAHTTRNRCRSLPSWPVHSPNSHQLVISWTS